MAADPALGTVGTALSKSPPPPAPPPDSSTTDTPPAPDNSGLIDVVRRNRDQITAQQNRSQEIDMRSAALRPPQMEQPPPPPQAQSTPVSERWGSVAMMLAGFGGLLTRQPLTASLNAMAAVNHAYNDGDAAAAKSAFDTWKVQNDNAMKMNDFSVKSYDAALKGLANDRAGALAQIRATAAALKDDVVLQLLDSGQTDRALQILGARATGSQQLSDRAEKLADAHAAIQGDIAANPNRPPQEQAVRNMQYLAGKDPDEAKGGAAGAADRDAILVANAEIAKQEAARGSPLTEAERAQIRLDARNQNKQAGRAPTATGAALAEDRSRAAALFKQATGHAYDPANASDDDTAMWNNMLDAAMRTRKAQSAPTHAPTAASVAWGEDDTRARAAFKQQTGHDYDPATVTDDEKLVYADAFDAAARKRKDASGPTKTLGVPAQELADITADLKAKHPDWTKGQLDMAANKVITESKQPVMSDDAADINARVALKTGHAPTTMGRSQANIAKFQDAYARVAKEQGLGADEIAANMVKFAGEMSEGRALGTTSARVDFAANELDVALPQALKLSQEVYRPGFKKMAQIEQALQGQTSDPDLLEFAQQNQAVMNAYALAMQRGGLSTVAGMDRAEHMLTTATSQAGYMRQLDRLHKEVQTILYGTAAAKQHLMNEITGGTAQITPPTLTNVPRPGQDGAGGDATHPIEGKTYTDKDGNRAIYRNGKFEELH